MPAYDVDRFDPPAPVAYVTLRHPTTGAIAYDVPLLMDTGADVTLLPQEFVEQLGILPDEGKVYELEGFGGDVKLANVVKLELSFLGRKFKTPCTPAGRRRPKSEAGVGLIMTWSI